MFLFYNYRINKYEYGPFIKYPLIKDYENDITSLKRSFTFHQDKTFLKTLNSAIKLEKAKIK